MKNALAVLRAQLDEVGFPTKAARKAVVVAQPAAVDGESPAQRRAAPKAAAKRKAEAAEGKV